VPAWNASLHVGLVRHGALQGLCCARTRTCALPGSVARRPTPDAPRLTGDLAVASRDDDRLRVQLAAPKNRAGRGAQRFVSQVLKQVSKAGAPAFGPGGERPASTFGRGRVAAGIAGQTLSVRARRVVIKARYVVLKNAGAKSVSTHLRYIERDGVTRHGARGQAYGLKTDAADLKEFEERGRGDRHQFRFIVSVEDAEQLHDLRAYTRDVMQRMATDLETELDWVAVDHWDTDNPHTHVVLRGRASDGKDLVIAPGYMAHGMRVRASEVATEWLGPRTELEIKQGLLREVEQERLTSIDRALLRDAADSSVVDLSHGPGDSRQSLQRARLQRLEAMGLATRFDANRWSLAPDVETTLVQLGERGDILRTMQRALRGLHRECIAEASTRNTPIVGRIAAKGLADELNDRGYLVVDGIDGRAHYVRLPAGADISALPLEGIVEAWAGARTRRVDQTIAELARDGVYRTTDHLAQLRKQGARDPQATIDIHVRRLEALRRGGIVERVAAGVWRVPAELVSRGGDHDARRTDGVVVELRSHLPIEQQVRAVGATWLDRQLLDDHGFAGDRGFAGTVRQGMQQRAVFLQEQGLAERRGQRLVLARDLLKILRDRDLGSAACSLCAQTGLVYRPSNDGERISGVYRRDVQLNSGRFAMLDDGTGFSLVPWNSALEQRMGRTLTAVVRGATATWDLRRHRMVGV
jgi:type IV secretory pathway VirD2 relaxase